MFKNKKETLKTLSIIGAFGVIGIGAALIIRGFFPFVGVVPAVSFTLIYTAAALNFILAHSVVDSVKGFFLERFCKSFHKKYPKSGNLYNELAFEREKLNVLANEYNNIPTQTQENINNKKNIKISLKKQQLKYNNKFSELSQLSKKEIDAFNKYNNLNDRLMPVVINENVSRDNVVVRNAEQKQEKTQQLVTEQTKTKNKNKETNKLQEQEVVVQPIGEDLLSKLKGDEILQQTKKESLASSKRRDGLLNSANEHKKQNK